MRAEDLQRLELINIDTVTGFPCFGPSRVILFGISSLACLQKDQIHSIGWEKTKSIFLRYGYDTGLTWATALAELYDFDTPEEWFKACCVVHKMAGFAEENITEIDLDKENNRMHFTGTWKNSFESYVWQTNFGSSSHPVCSVMLGMMSGCASAVLGSEVFVKELTCQAEGHPYCSFEGRSIAEWGMTSAEVQHYFSVSDLDNELSNLRLALKRARKDLVHKNAELTLLKNQARRFASSEDIIYRSKSMATVLLLAEKVAPSSSSVIIEGESGTGKEVIARYIHKHSGREDMPFMAINCAALPPNLLESELFGHKKGAFTGADKDKKGLFVEAGEGTLFLDEVGEIPIDIQAKLLRALQEKEVRPLGGTNNVPVKARIISATNRNLKTMVDENRFREDLYYRLAVFPIMITPLRQRREDILILARHFLSRLKKIHPGFSPDAVRKMENYSWPGNVRELENWVEYGVIMAGDDLIGPEHLPLPAEHDPQNTLDKLAENYPSLEGLERKYIEMVLHHTGGNKTEAARILGTSISTLWRRLKDEKGIDGV
ncbi:MAG TPA: sigma 54-interacting transcriptional regulator [Syntrophales bacterium]|nr:sigma 54-interacting transcriptional regulator [Syntrophales bacterium]